MAISGDNVAFEGSGQSGIYFFNGTTLTKVADRNTPIPGGVGNFTGFSYSGISGRNVPFVGRGGSGQEGIYCFDGAALRIVADRNTPIPGGVGNFTNFDVPVISGNNVAFIGGNSSTDKYGIYLFNGTTLSKVADFNTPVPGGSGNFTQFYYLAISGGNAAFWGLDSLGQRGVYLFSNGGLSKVADFNTSVPGGVGTFVSIDSSEISGDNVAVRGMDQSGIQRGIYLFNGTTLSKVADRNTPVPGGSGNFRDISYPKISGDLIVFHAVDSLIVNNGVYLFNGNILTKVADYNTPIPAGSGNFTAALNPEISGGNIAFVGGGVSGQLGIYLASLQSPQAISVPTVTQWGMIVMGILLGLSAIYRIRKKATV